MDKNGKVNCGSLAQHLFFAIQYSFVFFLPICIFFTKIHRFCFICWHLIFNFLESYFAGDTGRICEGVPTVGFELLRNIVSNY